MISRRRGLLLLALLPGAHRRAAAQTVLERPFTLVDTTGRIISDRDLRGRWLLVFFGYTSCPDICPTTLDSMGALLEQLGSIAARVQPVFITVDPARDTPAALGAYLTAFDQRIIGLTGKNDQIAGIAAIFGAQYFKVPGSDPKDYAFAHSSLIYVIGPEGGIVTQFSNANDPANMARILTSLIS
jgi:protein SCO1